MTDKLPTFATYVPNDRGELAIQIAVQSGLAATTPCGQDKAGRQASVGVPPVEVAERACEIAEQMFKEFERRGWMVRNFDPKTL